MTPRRIQRENLLTFGALFRSGASIAREKGLTPRQTCRVMRAALHRLAGGTELSADLLRALVELGEVPETTPEEFAALLQAEGDQAIAEAEAMEDRRP